MINSIQTINFETSKRQQACLWISCCLMYFRAIGGSGGGAHSVPNTWAYQVADTMPTQDIKLHLINQHITFLIPKSTVTFVVLDKSQELYSPWVRNIQINMKYLFPSTIISHHLITDSPNETFIMLSSHNVDNHSYSHKHLSLSTMKATPAYHCNTNPHIVYSSYSIQMNSLSHCWSRISTNMDKIPQSIRRQQIPLERLIFIVMDQYTFCCIRPATICPNI